MTSKILVGKQEISRYSRASWQTIRVWIRAEEFPAEKIDGVWRSITDMVDEWHKVKISARIQKE